MSCPGLLHALLGVELLAPEAGRRPRRRGRPRSTSKASASEWAGSVESTIVRSPASAQRSAVAAAVGGLADPALAGEEEDPHGVGDRSTWAFSSRSAVCMILVCGPRLTNPGSGTTSSTSSW